MNGSILKLGSCAGVYFDTDPKKTQEQKTSEYVVQAQEHKKALEASVGSANDHRSPR